MSASARRDIKSLIAQLLTSSTSPTVSQVSVSFLQQILSISTLRVAKQRKELAKFRRTSDASTEAAAAACGVSVWWVPAIP